VCSKGAQEPMDGKKETGMILSCRVWERLNGKTKYERRRRRRRITIVHSHLLKEHMHTHKWQWAGHWLGLHCWTLLDQPDTGMMHRHLVMHWQFLGCTHHFDYHQLLSSVGTQRWQYQNLWMNKTILGICASHLKRF
jgi:hypothetical protein